MKLKNVSPETISFWDKLLVKCANPLELDEKKLQDSLTACPPREYEGATFLGRYLDIIQKNNLVIRTMTLIILIN